MAMACSLEFKNQVVSRILSRELTIEAAHREYKVGHATLHRRLKQIKDGVSSNVALQGKKHKSAVPLPRGMNLRAAIAAEGHCQSWVLTLLKPVNSVAHAASLLRNSPRLSLSSVLTIL